MDIKHNLSVAKNQLKIAQQELKRMKELNISEDVISQKLHEIGNLQFLVNLYKDILK